MLRVLWNLPEQCEEAWRIGTEAVFELPTGFDQVVVTGLGGSAIGGDLLRVYATSEAAVPVLVNRDYRLPAFVGPRTLVFAVSYSGNTEETLSAYDDARARGASMMAVTTGGQLAERARRDGVPLVIIPGGISPRAASGYLFLPTLAVMQRVGLLGDAGPSVAETVNLLKEMREELGPQSPENRNLAKQLARRFFQRIPVIYGSSGTTETVAMRWKGQINENSKAMAYFNVFPELNHNEIVGTEKPAAKLKDLELIFLSDPADHPRVKARLEITRGLIGERVGAITEVAARGGSKLARAYSLIYVGDYASVYLALMYGIDPTPVKLIDALKKRLSDFQ
ncbi:MAG: bifunctional phosphoglucose/phosphomannose isomerase [Firmicutes bacterium]|nr:bifunctional phosphoglucose/phosphomannose isomerase [Bacillota bacterium]